jgi:hypothetical protein
VLGMIHASRFCAMRGSKHRTGPWTSGPCQIWQFREGSAKGIVKIYAQKSGTKLQNGRHYSVQPIIAE